MKGAQRNFLERAALVVSDDRERVRHAIAFQFADSVVRAGSGLIRPPSPTGFTTRGNHVRLQQRDTSARSTYFHRALR